MVICVVFKKPYAFLIKHFKIIHLFLTVIYIYLAIKVNSILKYYNNFSLGIVSKLDAVHYITSYYIIAILASIIICIVIYALMRYKKKPRTLYLLLIGFSLVIAWLINYSYQGLETIYISVLDTRSIRWYQDLLRILSWVQYLTIAVVLVRGLGFDIKKFNFVHDLEDLGIDVNDEEEVELTLGNTNTIWRKLRRHLREFKYYYFENRIFINIIVIVIVALIGFSLVIDKEVVNKVYQQNEVFSTDQFTFNVLESYITNRDFDNQEIMNNNTSFVVVRIRLSSNVGKKVLNTGNLILKVNNHSYSSDKKYAARFKDLGSAYRDQKIDEATDYLFIYNVINEDINEGMKIVYAEDKTVNLSPIKLDQSDDIKNYKLGDKVDFSESSLGSGSLLIHSFEVQDKFSYPYQYEIAGQIYTNQLTITSVQNIILHLVMESFYPYELDNYSFLEKYGVLHYKIDDKEYTSSVFENKTPGNYKEGLYLSVDKDIANATSIWLDIKIRNKQYLYTLK